MAEKTFLDNFTPKQAFVMGVVLTVLALGTIGFVWTLKGGTLNLGSKSANRGAPPAKVAANPSRGAAPTAKGNARPVGDEDHIRGNIDAPITVIEYSDFQCPFCARFHPTMNQVVSNNDDVRWVYRHFPLSSIHPDAQKAAEASECAAEQDRFWDFADKLFGGQDVNGVGRAQLTAYAKELGLNTSKFDDCVDSGKYASKVQADAADAQAAGGTGTPFSVIVADGQQIPVSGAVPLSQIESILSSLRQ